MALGDIFSFHNSCGSSGSLHTLYNLIVCISTTHWKWYRLLSEKGWKVRYLKKAENLWNLSFRFNPVKSSYFQKVRQVFYASSNLIVTLSFWTHLFVNLFSSRCIAELLERGLLIYELAIPHLFIYGTGFPLRKLTKWYFNPPEYLKHIVGVAFLTNN